MNKRAVKLDVNEVPQTKPLSFEEQTVQNQVLFAAWGKISIEANESQILEFGTFKQAKTEYFLMAEIDYWSQVRFLGKVVYNF